MMTGPLVVSELVSILLASQSFDAGIRREATQKLLTAGQTNFEEYVAQLAQVLYAEELPAFARQLAGLLLKNAVSASDPVIDRERRAKWQKVLPHTRNGIKELTLLTLKSPCKEAQTAACQVIAKVGRLDLLAQSWPQLLASLMNLVVTPDTPVDQVKAGLTAMAYLCEDLATLMEDTEACRLAPEDRNLMITTVSHAMKHPRADIVLAGCKAFYHALYFARDNMAIQTERDYIFQLIGQCVNHADLSVQHAAWECILQLAACYYEYLDAYAASLGEHSIRTIQAALASDGSSDAQKLTETVALAAIEFWNTLCDLECIAVEERGSETASKNYIRRGHTTLLPVLFEAMATHTSGAAYEDQADEWTLGMAAGTCVSLCAQVLKDDILPEALSFVDRHFMSEDWKRREAAVLVYGSIMEGPSSASLQPMIARSFPLICKALQDPSVAVRDTTAWTIGRIISFHASCVEPFISGVADDTDKTSSFMSVLINLLGDEPRVAAYACFAIHELARNVSSLENRRILDPFFSHLTQCLMRAWQRNDAGDNNLRASAFEALAELVDVVEDPACFPVMQALLKELLSIIERVVEMPSSPEVSQLEGLICGCCNNLINRLGKVLSDLPEASKLFAVFLKVVQEALKQAGGTEPTEPHAVFKDEPQDPSASECEEEDAVLAIGTLIQNFPKSIEPQVPALLNVLIAGLQNLRNVRFGRASIGVVCELAGAYDLSNFYVEPLMNALYKLLHDPSAPISLKPSLITTVGDIAVSMGTNFDIYLEPFLELLEHAASTEITDGPNNDEWIAYFQDLRNSVLEAYACILHPHRNQDDYLKLAPHVAKWLNLIHHVVSDEFFSPSNFTRAVEVTCDMVATFREDLATVLTTTPFYATMIQKGEASGDDALMRKIEFLKKAVLRCTVV